MINYKKLRHYIQNTLLMKYKLKDRVEVINDPDYLNMYGYILELDRDGEFCYYVGFNDTNYNWWFEEKSLRKICKIKKPKYLK